MGVLALGVFDHALFQPGGTAPIILGTAMVGCQEVESHLTNEYYEDFR